MLTGFRRARIFLLFSVFALTTSRIGVAQEQAPLGAALEAGRSEPLFVPTISELMGDAPRASDPLGMNTHLFGFVSYLNQTALEARGNSRAILRAHCAELLLNFLTRPDLASAYNTQLATILGPALASKIISDSYRVQHELRGNFGGMRSVVKAVVDHFDFEASNYADGDASRLNSTFDNLRRERLGEPTPVVRGDEPPPSVSISAGIKFAERLSPAKHVDTKAIEAIPEPEHEALQKARSENAGYLVLLSFVTGVTGLVGSQKVGDAGHLLGAFSLLMALGAPSIGFYANLDRLKQPRDIPQWSRPLILALVGILSVTAGILLTVVGPAHHILFLLGGGAFAASYFYGIAALARYIWRKIPLSTKNKVIAMGIVLPALATSLTNVFARHGRMGHYLPLEILGTLLLYWGIVSLLFSPRKAFAYMRKNTAPGQFLRYTSYPVAVATAVFSLGLLLIGLASWGLSFLTIW